MCTCTERVQVWAGSVACRAEGARGVLMTSGRWHKHRGCGRELEVFDSSRKAWHRGKACKHKGHEVKAVPCTLLAAGRDGGCNPGTSQVQSASIPKQRTWQEAQIMPLCPLSLPCCKWILWLNFRQKTCRKKNYGAQSFGKRRKIALSLCHLPAFPAGQVLRLIMFMPVLGAWKPDCEFWYQ